MDECKALCVCTGTLCAVCGYVHRYTMCSVWVCAPVHCVLCVGMCTGTLCAVCGYVHRYTTEKWRRSVSCPASVFSPFLPRFSFRMLFCPASRKLAGGTSGCIRSYELTNSSQQGPSRTPRSQLNSRGSVAPLATLSNPTPLNVSSLYRKLHCVLTPTPTPFNSSPSNTLQGR